MNYEQFAAEVIQQAIQAGADEADLYLQTGTEFGVTVRKGEIETLTQAGSKALGLRVFVDKRLGFASTSDFRPDALVRLIGTAVALAQAADRKEENGLPEELPSDAALPDLRLYDPEIETVPTDRKIALAKACEAAAYALDPRITTTEGAGFGNTTTQTVLANSRGAVYAYRSAACSLYCQPLAEADGKKQLDYEYSYRRFFSKLDSPEQVGQKAAARALQKLGARKAPTQNAPVIFDRRVAPRIWYAVLAAVNGDTVYKGMSFLKDKLGEKVAAETVTLIDDGTLPEGAGSAPFDGEGLPTRRNVILENGVLRQFLYDTTTARKVGNGAQSTANARRSPGGTPGIGPFNLYLTPGDLSPEAMIAALPNGFYVTGLMGAGANIVTGDFSCGASGLWIENGAVAYPVEEVTIAGTMSGILQSIERIGSDLIFNGAVVSPTFQVAEMTVSGA
jgi:PmbA protein